MNGNETGVSAGAGKKPRSLLGAKDMVWSMGLVTLVVAVSLIFTWKPAPDEIRTVDHTVAVRQAVDVAPYRVLAPEGLPAGWRATSARIEPQDDGSIQWSIGFVTPKDEYVGYTQRGNWPAAAAKAKEKWLAQATRNGTPDATATWSSPQGTWQRLVGDSDPDERRSLVREEGQVVTVLSGTAQWAELEAFAQSLRPQAKQS